MKNKKRRQSPNWNCPVCKELVPHNFVYCWHCGADETGNPDRHFISFAEPPTAHTRPQSRILGLLSFVIWAATCLAFLITASLLDNWLPSQWSARIAGTLSLFLVGVIAGVIVNLLAQTYPVLAHYCHPLDTMLGPPADQESPVSNEPAKQQEPSNHDPN